MNAHQVSQLTNAARTAPVVITANKDEVAGQPIKENVYLNYVKEDSLEVDQREPENFKPISNRERSNVDSFTMDRSHLTSQFYGKIQELKNEHQKTLTLLNQFYEQEKNKSTDGTKAAMKRRQINYLAPDYLDNTENNTFFYGNTPYRGPDKVPGYTKADFDSRSSQEKSDDMKDFSDDVSEIVSDSDSIDVINRMWDEFSIDKYSDAGNRRPEKNDTKCQYVANKQRPQSATTKKKEWKPVITIPKPFNMTLRDEKKSEKSHTRSSMDVSLRQKIKEEEEEQERRKRIRARDPPTHIYLPLYEEMCERREQRSRFNKQTSVSATLAIQKPFSFAERDERALKIQKMKKNEVEAERLAEIKSSTNFEAQPIPRGVVDSSAGDRRSEDVLYRRIKAKMRAEDLIRSSAYPPRMRAHEALSKHKKQVWLKEIESESACTFRPRISNPPDFNALHKRESIEIANRHSASEVVVQPFTLHTSLRSKSRMSVSEGQSNPGKSPLKLGKMPSFSDTIPTRMTDSSRQRMNNTWRSLEDAELVMKRGKIGDAEQAERRRMLARKVKQRAAINDGSASAVASHDERSRRNKKELHERQVDYNQFLRDVKRKVDERPLLIEQHDERVAKEQAERKYAKILEESGLSPDLLNKNGRSDSRTDDYATSMSRDILWTNNSVIPSETVTVKSSMKPLNNQSPQEKSSQKLVRSSQTIISDNERRRPPKRAPKIQLRPHWIKYWRPFPNLFDEFYVFPKRTYKETGIRRPKQRKKLMGKIRDKSMVSQAVSYITTEHNEKQQYYQHKMVENDKEYRKFLNEIQQKVDDRPLLIDQHDERVVKEKALRRYEDILNRNGLSPDFVIRKVKTNRESDVSRYTYDPDLGMKKKKTLTRKRWDDEKTCDELKPYNPVEMKLNMMLTKIQPDVTVDDEIKKQKTINRISTSKKQFLKKHKHFGIAIKPCWVTYWQQTPQPRLYDYVTLQKRWFDW